MPKVAASLRTARMMIKRESILKSRAKIEMKRKKRM
jgi:hypothetical protein